MITWRYQAQNLKCFSSALSLFSALVKRLTIEQLATGDEPLSFLFLKEIVQINFFFNIEYVIGELSSFRETTNTDCLGSPKP